MFEQPAPEANWWTAVRAALLEGDEPLVEEYDSRLDLGVRVFYRETMQEPSSREECPLAIETEAGADESGHRELARRRAGRSRGRGPSNELKIDAPLPETIASAAAALGDTGRRVIVLVTTGLPDSCSVIDGLCAMDPSVAAVQAARAEGIEVYVLGLGENDNVDWDFTTAPPDQIRGLPRRARQRRHRPRRGRAAEHRVRRAQLRGSIRRRAATRPTSRRSTTESVAGRARTISSTSCSRPAIPERRQRT